MRAAAFPRRERGPAEHRGRASGRHSQVQEELDFLAGAVPTAAEAAHGGGGERGTRRRPDPTAPGDGAEMAAAPSGRRA